MSQKCLPGPVLGSQPDRHLGKVGTCPAHKIPDSEVIDGDAREPNTSQRLVQRWTNANGCFRERDG
jgi:hypothetical protein